MIQIKNIRKEQNLTQAELGKKIGVGASTITMWETGKRNPTITKLKKLAEIFNCTIDELIDKE